MTGYLKGTPVSQVDSILINTVMYTEKDIKWLLENYKDKIPKEKKKKV